MAFVKFSVLDKDDASQDDLIGNYTIRFENIRQGISNLKIFFLDYKNNLQFFRLSTYSIGK